MLSINRKNISINAAFVAVIASAVFLAPCSGDDDSIDLFKGLPPALAAFLIEGDEGSLREYGQETGLESMVNAKRHFEALIQGMPQQDYLRYSDSLYILQRNLCDVLAEEYNYHFFLNDLEFLETFPPGTRQEIMIARADIWVTANNADIEPEAKIDSITGYYEMMAGNDDTYGMGIAKMALFNAYDAIGDMSRAKHYLIEASDDFSEIGFHRLTCQALGVLGIIYEREGLVDSMEMSFQKAREVAIDYRLPNQISRISYFYARRFARMGRLALANDMFNEAIELCREYKGGYIEIRYIYHAMEFYSEYSCWDTVERLLSRANVLGSVYDDQRYSRHFDIGTKFIEAQWLMARGDVTNANALYSEIESPSIDTPSLVNHYNHLYFWARGLLDNGFTEDAIKIIDRGLSSPVRKPLPLEEGKFLALKARAEFERGNIGKIRDAIARFDLVSLRSKNPLLLDGITCDVLRARIALNKGDRAEAFACLEDGLSRLREFVGLMDISVQGYLWINECHELRRLMHELTAHDSKLRYGAELFWRNLALDMGENLTDPAESFDLAMAISAGSGIEESTTDDRGLADHFKALAETAMSKIDKLDAVHLMYLVDNDCVTLFTVTSDDIRCAAIPCAGEELQDLAAETYRYMSCEVESGTTEDPIDVRENLTELGRYLLPGDLIDHARPGNPRTLLVSTDDFLGRIPFGTFNISSDKGYVPLVEHFDVAHLRHFENKYLTSRSENPGLIVVNSSSDKSLRTRCPFAHKLKCIKAEGRAVADLYTVAVLLQGSKVTKREIKKRWEDVSYLYFATHILRDPEIPFLVLIPLVSPDGSSPESGYLDFSDIRSADFSRCELVVLSGCSSGAPSVAVSNVGPSLGDAFLDAGACAVITTFWDIKDEEALKLMTSYTRELETGGRSHIRALCEARRAMFRENPDPLGSFGWASYAINIGNLSAE